MTQEGWPGQFVLGNDRSARTLGVRLNPHALRYTSTTHLLRGDDDLGNAL